MKTLSQLSDIDRKITLKLAEVEINSAEILDQVDTREQILLTLISIINENDELAQLPEWHDAIKRTQLTVELMQKKTAELGSDLKKYRYGNKSVQQYKKFL